MSRLSSALSGPVLTVAPTLLGGVLRHGPVAVRITEVEAYDGPDDPGSHAYRGRTERNATMFGPPGHLYVYFTYGMHHCCNVVCSPDGVASGSLIRAGEVIEGEAVARERRGHRAPARELARGPARLAAALGIDRRLDGCDLSRGPVFLELSEVPVAAIRTGPRVGLRHAADRPWRFWIEGEVTVSAYRPAAPRRSPRVRPGS